jgi:Cu-Zn family superoxide dismutase
MTQLKRLAMVGLAVLGSTLLLAAAQPAKEAPKDAPKKAICVLQPTKGNKASGIVTFTQRDGAIEIEGEITGLTPGEHGFHVHEFGDLNSMDGSATGGHFNPEKEKHGGPHDAERHVGDLGNIEAIGNGTAKFKITDKLIKLYGKHSIIGHGLIVHAKADDLKSQPSGDAGGRVCQGVIGVAK